MHAIFKQTSYIYSCQDSNCLLIDVWIYGWMRGGHISHAFVTTNSLACVNFVAYTCIDLIVYSKLTVWIAIQMCQFKLLTTTRVLQIILMSRLQCCIEGDRVNFIHALQILNSIPRSNKSIIRMHECHHHCVPHREPSQTGVASLVFLQRRRSQCHPRVAYFMDHSEKLIYIALAFEKMLVSVALQHIRWC